MVQWEQLVEGLILFYIFVLVLFGYRFDIFYLFLYDGFQQSQYCVSGFRWSFRLQQVCDGFLECFYCVLLVVKMGQRLGCVGFFNLRDSFMSKGQSRIIGFFDLGFIFLKFVFRVFVIVIMSFIRGIVLSFFKFYRFF